MTADDAARVVRSAIARLGAAAARQRAATAARLGLQATDLLALSHIVRVGEIQPGELAQILRFTPSGMTRVIRRLVDADLATRLPGPANQQNVILRPSRRGAEVVRQTTIAVDEAIGSMVSSLPAAQVRLLERVLSDLATAAERDAERLVTESEAANREASGVRRPVRWG
jgi:DNA-binding MarR family transcriptional regulator